MDSFTEELINLISKYSKENDTDTPDFILAKYLEGCLRNFSQAVNARDDWYDKAGIIVCACGLNEIINIGT